MKEYGILMHSTPIGIATEHDGRWLKEYDPTAGKHGRIVSTSDAKEAKRFASHADGWEEYRRSHGFRTTDGKPNRPLTAWSISIEPLP